MSEAVDAWVWATYNECFPPCGTHRPPNSDNWQCRCKSPNPDHYIRISLDVMPALRGKDRSFVSANKLTSSTVCAILTRQGERAKTSATNADECRHKASRHLSLPGNSAIYGRIRLTQGTDAGAGTGAPLGCVAAMATAGQAASGDDDAMAGPAVADAAGGVPGPGNGGGVAVGAPTEVDSYP